MPISSPQLRRLNIQKMHYNENGDDDDDHDDDDDDDDDGTDEDIRRIR